MCYILLRSDPSEECQLLNLPILTRSGEEPRTQSREPELKNLARTRFQPSSHSQYLYWLDPRTRIVITLLTELLSRDPTNSAYFCQNLLPTQAIHFGKAHPSSVKQDYKGVIPERINWQCKILFPQNPYRPARCSPIV